MNRVLFAVTTIGGNLLIANIIPPPYCLAGILIWTCTTAVYYKQIAQALGIWR
jgi:hypothetical protein